MDLGAKGLRRLEHLAKYRWLTVPQLAALEHFKVRASRKWLAALVERKLASHVELPALRGVPGRPESAFCLTTAGTKLLGARGESPTDGSLETPGKGSHGIAHHVLLNWLRIHLADMPERVPGMSVPAETWGRQLLPGVSFIPDGAFVLAHAARPQRLLFFLEVDRGTESLGGSPSGKGSLREKVTNYQRFFRERTYKGYEELWHSQFTGFRLLILAETPERLGALCRLVQALPPSNFIWLTDRSRLLAHGLAGVIWTRGGREGQPGESLLGPTLACSSPLPVLDS